MVRFRAYRRFVVVAYQFLPLLLAYARDRRRFLLFGSGRRVTPEMRRERAEALLASLLTLGPTFIKLGQLLSTRPDILPPEYVERFTELQDNVPPAPWAEAEPVIEEELGPVEAVFEEFDTDPISGASLGQVYRGTLDGRSVAVKVRRPGVEELVAADLQVIRWTLPVVLYFVDEARSFSLETLADEFDTVIHQEMDYYREREMLEEISGNFEDYQGVVIPDVDEDHSTGRVLTMDYEGGTKISNIEAIDDLGVDRTLLAERLQRVYLKMIITDGVFHADPHPGNLAVREDGALVFYDFGMSGRVDPYIQDKIVDFYAAVAERDTEAILDALIDMGTLSPEADRKTMGEVMELAIADARGEDIEQYRVQQIVSQVEDTIYEFPLRLPSNLALVLRVATVVEGVCVTLDPDFDFIAVATQFLREEGFIEEGAREYLEDRVGEVREASRVAAKIPPKLDRALNRIEREDFHVRADIEDSDNNLDRLARRLITGMVLTATTVSTAILYAFSTVEATAVAGGLSILLLAVLYRSFGERSGIRAQPQFTRQNLRRRRQGPGERPGERD